MLVPFRAVFAVKAAGAFGCYHIGIGNDFSRFLVGVTINSASNIYGASAEGMRELFGDFVTGNDDAMVLALSARPLSPGARTAIERSLEAFGYGAGACAFGVIGLDGEDADGPGAGANTAEAGGADADGEVLDPQALFLLVEGLDPYCIIVSDDASRRALERAYRCNLAPDSAARAFGRQAAVFSDLDRLVETDDDKQRAWAILKSLPRR